MTAKYLTSILISLSTILAIHAQTNGILVPNYESVEHQARSYVIRQPLVLNCNSTVPGVQVTWEKNGTDVAKVKELEKRYKLYPEANQFIIEKTEPYDEGLYSCVANSANNERKDIKVIARVVVGLPSNQGVVEGEKLTISCSVLGTNPELSWHFGNLTITNQTGGRYVLKADDKNVENAILTIENVSMTDAGLYKCKGRNLASEFNSTSEAYDTCNVRVKGKLAALWPFLGICAEVLILCTIILIYEKRRNKSELEESDTDPQEQ